MTYLKNFLFILFIAISIASYGQKYSSTNKKAIKLYEQSLLAYNSSSRDYKQAIVYLREALEKDSNFTEANSRLGSIYKSIGDHANAKPYLIRAAKLKPNSRDFIHIYDAVGDYYLDDAEYDKAKEYFQMVVNLQPDKKILIENAQRKIETCTFAAELKKKPLNFKPVKMSPVINKFFLQAYPVVTADEQFLIFTKRDGPEAKQDEDIMISNKVNNEWSAPLSISSNINTEFNEGACTMSSDGKILVFTSCNRPGGLGACDLYISYRKGDQWSKPENLGANVNSTAWDSEPSLSADGRTLYFTSQRPGGFGAEDIWVTKLDEKDEWTPAQNLGKSINSKGREVSPFIHASGNTLYFSSNYYPGMGAFDIYYSRYDGNTWSAPKNIGYPINSQIDDATIFISPDNKKGYYAPYDKKDMRVARAYLHEFEVPEAMTEELKSTYAKGTVMDAETNKKLGARIELFDITTNRVVQSVSSDPVNGDYLIVLTEGKEYALYVQSEGYLFKSVFFDFKNPAQFNPLALDVFLDPIKAGKASVLNNIFFATNSYQLEEKSKTELDKIVAFLTKNPKVSIEFGGHTDDVGSDNDNMNLSMKRAKAVYDYIVSKGIVATRLKYQGYGETKPVLPNTSDENRKSNRRIEFKILKNQ